MVVALLKAIATCASTDGLPLCDAREYHRAKSAFVSANPSYSDSTLSALRKREFARLDATSSVYLDYTGAALYPASLVREHGRWLTSSVAGNPHSTSPASLHSSAAADEARAALLAFFDADPAEYDVVWTSNATAGLRIVGETYDFANKTMLIPRDAHNSLNSLARKAQQGGGRFEFIEFDSPSGEAISAPAYRRALDTASPSSEKGRGLVFLTGQSNITGAKLDLSLVQYAQQRGWDVGLDAAALAPSTRLSLRQLPVDFMVVSLYKIVGWPTGLGALILRKSQYANLTQKSTFFGGNIVGITMDTFDFTLVDGPERFEDGTANFAAMAAVRPGLEFAARWMPHYTARNRILMAWLIEQLEAIHHPGRCDEKTDSPRSSSTFSHKHSATGGAKLVRTGGPKDLDARGSTFPLVLTSAEGDALNYRFVIWAAARQRISLRGGPCMCNPGASSAVMQRGTITDLAASTLLAEADVGIVRISLGAPTNFMDVWRLVRFLRMLTEPQWVSAEWRAYERLHPGARLSNNIDHLHALATGKSL